MPEHRAAGWQTPIWAEYRRLVSEAEAEARGAKPVELVEVGVVVGLVVVEFWKAMLCY